MKTGALGAVTALFAALLPFVTARFIYGGGENAKYFLTMMFACALLLLTAQLVHKGQLAFSLRGRWLLVSLVLVLAVHYVATLAGLYPERSLWSDIRSSGVLFLTGTAIITVLLGERLDSKEWSLVRRAIALSAGAFGFISLLGIEGLGLLNKFLWINLRVGGLTFGNSTFAGTYLVLALIIALVELSRTEPGTKVRKALIASVILILFSSMLFSFGSLADPMSFLGDARSSSATAWLLVVFLGGWKLLKNKFARRIWSGLFLVGASAGIALLFTPGSFVQEKYIESSTAARIIVWESSVEAIVEQPLLGYGPENFEEAIEKHFDNRLYLDENIGEVWFDRAHNIILDTLIGTGVVGSVSVLILIACFLTVIVRAAKIGLIGEWEAVLLAALPVAHFLQLQTAFDTTGSYALLGLVAGYALWLERQMAGGGKIYSPQGKIAPVLLTLLALVSFKFLVFDEYQRQVALVATLRTADSAKQEVYIRESLTRTSSFVSLRLSSSSFIKGALAHLAQGGDAGQIIPRLSVYEGYYKTYLADDPNYYRARMNYSYLLLIKTALGEDRVEDAKALLKDSYALSPENPLTYALDAVASLYAGKPAEARSIMNKGLALNPDLPFSKEISAYIERQAAQFPNITILELKNL